MLKKVYSPHLDRNRNFPRFVIRFEIRNISSEKSALPRIINSRKSTVFL